MTRYAEATRVGIAQTQVEIRKLLQRAGSTGFSMYELSDKAEIIFEMKDRRIKFALNVNGLTEQQRRSRWRALLLVIKAKIESIESNIETFDEAFLAHIVTPEGPTVMEAVFGIGVGTVALLEPPKKVRPT